MNENLQSEKDFIEKGREGLKGVAHNTLNMSFSQLENPSIKNNHERSESILKNAIASASHLTSSGEIAVERTHQMTRKFDNALRFMKGKEDIEISNATMITAFQNSLDKEAVICLDQYLTPENKARVERALSQEDDNSPLKRKHESGGPSLN